MKLLVRFFVFVPVFVLVLLASCSKPEPGEVAAQTAKVYYEHLIAGRYDDFLAGEYRPDSITESYRSELVDNAKMFMAQQRANRKGIREVLPGHAAYDADSHTADVFLVFVYGNGDSEQVLVPMVEKDGVWFMR